MKYVYYGKNKFNLKKFEKELNSKGLDGLGGLNTNDGVNKFKKYFVFSLKDDSNILSIENGEDLKKLSENYDKLSKEFDAVVFSPDLNDSRKGSILVFNLSKVVPIESNTFLIFLIFILGFVLVFLSLVATKSINIHGTKPIDKVTWDVHYENLVVSKGSVNATKAATIKDGNIAIVYEVPLLIPGQFYEFTVDVVNEGSIPAKVSATPTLGGVSKDNELYLKYTATYANGKKVKVNDVLDVGEKVTYKVRAEFVKKLELEELPKEDIKMELTFAVNYAQKD